MKYSFSLAARSKISSSPLSSRALSSGVNPKGDTTGTATSDCTSRVCIISPSSGGVISRLIDGERDDAADDDVVDDDVEYDDEDDDEDDDEVEDDDADDECEDEDRESGDGGGFGGVKGSSCLLRFSNSMLSSKPSVADGASISGVFGIAFCEKLLATTGSANMSANMSICCGAFGILGVGEVDFSGGVNGISSSCGDSILSTAFSNFGRSLGVDERDVSLALSPSQLVEV